MIGPIITGLVFSALVIILSLFKPNACRIFLGFFFIAMGLGINLPFLITQPYFVYEYGMGAWLPLYRILTESIIGLNPKLFGVLLIIFETSMGVFILMKGKIVKIGLVGMAVFIILLVPLYTSQIAWAFSFLGIVNLLRVSFDKDFIMVIRKK